MFPSAKDLSRTEKSDLTSLQKTRIPFIEETSKQIGKSSVALLPINDIGYVYKRKEVRRKQDMSSVVEERQPLQKTLSLQRIENSIHHPELLRSIAKPETVVIHQNKINHYVSLSPPTHFVSHPLTTISNINIEIIAIMDPSDEGSTKRRQLISPNILLRLVHLRINFTPVL